MGTGHPSYAFYDDGNRRSPDYLTRFVESEIRKWAEPIRLSGVSVE
jgi:hypothetical protein